METFAAVRDLSCRWGDDRDSGALLSLAARFGVLLKIYPLVVNWIAARELSVVKIFILENNIGHFRIQTSTTL